MDKPKIIGEGTYGCVAKPSLACQGKKVVNYKNKVSKIMLEKHAISEYNEMKEITSIQNIDKYVVSLPEMCVPVPDLTFKTVLKDCENKKFVKEKNENFRLLVYEDGGVSLKQFTTDLLPLLDRPNIHIFLTRIFHLLQGLCFFHDHDIVHHDIKSRNIVYNIDTNVIKFIDFGLVKRRSRMITDSSTNKNTMAQKWDNFPPEYDMANKEDFDAMYRGKRSYQDFIERLAYTFDAYSFGHMMKHLLVEIGGSSAMRPDIRCLKELFLFFKKMGDKNIETRDYDIFTFPEAYKLILQKHKVWSTEKGTPSASILNIQNQLAKITDLSVEEIQSLKKVLDCPDTKERNPATKRCVNKCKPGFFRNSKFQCRKTRSIKKCADDSIASNKCVTAKSRSLKKCTDKTKELNPKTNRCVNKCKPGFARNHLFLCRKAPK